MRTLKLEASFMLNNTPVYAYFGKPLYMDEMTNMAIFQECVEGMKTSITAIKASGAELLSVYMTIKDHKADTIEGKGILSLFQ